jgi:hypothetical protein
MTPTTGTGEIRNPELFVPHPNLSDEINHNICQSEIEGGVWLDRLPVGTVLEMETANHLYELQHRGNGRALITGHPKFCPEPVLVNIHGSTWGRAMLKMHFVGRGMFLEFDHPEYGVIRTSRIQEIRERRTASRRAPRFGYAG